MNDDFPKEIGEAGKFGIIEEEKKDKKKQTCPKCGKKKVPSLIVSGSH